MPDGLSLSIGIRLVAAAIAAVATISAVAAISAAVAATVATKSSTIAATTAAIAPVAAFATRTFFTWLRLVDAKSAAFKVLFVERCNGRKGFFAVRHFHKAEASGFAGEFIEDHACRADGPVGLKRGPKVHVRRTVRKITNEYVHYLLYLSLFLLSLVLFPSPDEPATVNSGVISSILK